jgi:hypothetical protein
VILLACQIVLGDEPPPAFRATEPAPRKARAVVVEAVGATTAFVPQAAVVEKMLDRGLQRWTTKGSGAAGWGSLVGPDDVVGIKIYSAPGEIIGTRSTVVQAVVSGLLRAGVAADRIIIWDKFYADLRRAGFVELGRRLGVRVAGAAEAGWDENATYESSLVGKPVWGDFEFGRKGPEVGRRSFYSRLPIREVTRHIVISPLLNHNGAGVTGSLMSLALGSVDNSIRFQTRPAAMAEAVPEIFGRPELFDHLALVIVDALICQYQGEESNRLHYAVMLNQLRFSTDPVALDVLSLIELEKQRQSAGLPARHFPQDLYRNAALLELGVADPRRVLVERVSADDGRVLRPD